MLDAVLRMGHSSTHALHEPRMSRLQRGKDAMSTVAKTAAEISGPYVVTFFNETAGRRGVLVDNVDKQTAEAVKARFSDKRDRFTYLPQVRVELASQVAA